MPLHAVATDERYAPSAPMIHSHWRRISILVGEYFLLSVLLIGLVVIDNRFIHHGGSSFSFISLAVVIFIAACLAFIQLPERSAAICFFASIPVFIYAWMLGFLFGGAGL